MRQSGLHYSKSTRDLRKKACEALVPSDPEGSREWRRLEMSGVMVVGLMVQSLGF